MNETTAAVIGALATASGTAAPLGMDQILLAIGVPLAYVGPLALIVRYGAPYLVHFIRVWIMDRTVRRAAGNMYADWATEGKGSTPPSKEELILLLTGGVGYVMARAPSTVKSLELDENDVKAMVRGEFGQMLLNLPRPSINNITVAEPAK